jgi:hypothetical protein
VVSPILKLVKYRKPSLKVTHPIKLLKKISLEKQSLKLQVGKTISFSEFGFEWRRKIFGPLETRKRISYITDSSGDGR